ncbi:MAG: hypothetical protein Q7O66_23645 [Dehalococcoidia bacterium]|nr:hypothetical protein [Dehalococcoidia bacterium]
MLTPEVRLPIPIPFDDFKKWLEAEVYTLTEVAADRVRERTYGLYTDMSVGGVDLAGKEIHFRLQRLGERTLVTARPSGGGEVLLGQILEAIAVLWPEAMKQVGDTGPATGGVKGRPPGGSPGLGREEWVDRLTKVLRAEEISRLSPEKTQPELIKEIGWGPAGTPESRVKKFQQARDKLARLRRSDCAGMLAEAAERLRKERKGT